MRSTPPPSVAPIGWDTPWDCVERLGRCARTDIPGDRGVTSWLSRVFDAADTDTTRLIGRLWFISAAARVAQPGSTAPYVLLLEGPADIGKSSALIELARSSNEQRFIMTLQLGPGETVEARVQRYRDQRAKGVHAASALGSLLETAWTEPERCVFAATSTEHTTPLTDLGGKQNTWPVRVTQVNRSTLSSMREQLWAEARALHAAGYAWWPIPRTQWEGGMSP